MSANDWRCEHCDGIYSLGELLTAANPFDPADQLQGCPNCKSVDCFAAVCDEPGCSSPTTCGTPTTDGYRRTCVAHCPTAGVRCTPVF